MGHDTVCDYKFMPYDLSNNNTKYYIRNTDIEKWFMLKLYTFVSQFALYETAAPRNFK